MDKKSTIGIIGLGRFGMSLAIELSSKGKNVICLDKDEKKVKEVLNYTDYAYVSEDLSKETLEELGFKECDTIVVCIGEKSDISILTTLNAISLGVEKVIAKAGNEDQGKVLERLGAEVVYPDKDSADRLAKKILSHNIMDFISLNENIEIVEIAIPKRYIGVKLLDSDIRKKYNLNIVAIERDDNIDINISPNHVFKENDAIVVVGNTNNIAEFEK